MTPLRCDHRQCTDESHLAVLHRLDRLEAFMDFGNEASFASKLMARLQIMDDARKANRMLVMANAAVLVGVVVVHIPQVVPSLQLLWKVVHP